MDIATGAMNALLPKLGELVVSEYKLQKGVKGEIEELEEELRSMTAALHKVAAVPADQLDEQVNIWASDVRELSYDIEDGLDTFMLKGKGHEPANSFFKGIFDRATNLFNKAKTNHQIHSVIKDIMSQVKKVSERRDRCRVDGITTRQDIVDVDPRLEAMYRKAAELVGIGQPKDELAKQILEQDSSSKQQSNIVSIVGFGGLGKTTLANSLLQDLKENFDCHFFASVSLNPDIKKIFKNILVQLDEKEYAHIDETWEMMQLINKIQGFLENRRFLCIIDDVWKESAWETIKLAVQDAKHGNKIIITTRNRAIAEHIGGVVYDLKPLSDDDSRNLLCKRIFDSIDNCPDDLNEVTEKILKKCGGVPLAIITTASLLASKPRHPQEWENVNKAIRFGLGDSLDVGKMRKILSLSYNDLPFHLKTCLLSLSKYPEDEVIRKDVLVLTWIAEGFIIEEKGPAGTSLQEIGESYFSELINRSLIQPVEGDDPFHCIPEGGLYACRVHDMVLELINQLSVEEGFVTTYLSDGQLACTRTFTVQKKKIRRLSLHSSNKCYASPESREQLSKVRSLSVFGSVDSVPPMSSFHVLRVLHLEDCACLDKKNLSDLGRLRLLRFLCLRNYLANELPESIGKLESLETLDIRCLNNMHEILLPTSFVRLRKLVRLFASRVKLAQGLTLGDMNSVQELNLHYSPDIKEIGDLKQLRTLRISFSSDDVETTVGLPEYILTSLQRCTNLRELEMGVDRSHGTTEVDIQQVPSGLRKFECNYFAMKVFPSWINSSTLSCLTILSISLTRECFLPHHLEQLAGLPSLRFLRLYLVDTVEKSLLQKVSVHSGAHAFRCLREFVFFGKFAPSFQPGAMPQLQRLYVWIDAIERDDLNNLGLENLSSLRHVIIRQIFRGSGVTEADVMESVRDHPNHPSLEIV